jgi:hypothetical protein
MLSTRQLAFVANVAAVLSATACSSPSAESMPASADVTVATADAATPSPAERGQYLTRIMGCNDCHTPWTMTERGPEPDMTRQLSGHPQDLTFASGATLAAPWEWAGSGTNTAFSGPFGVSFAANLTPDPETGLGKWTAETFVATIRNGRHEGQGRPLLPPMPWPMYRQATDGDLQAIFAYLQTLPAIKNRVPLPLDPPGAQ